MILERNGDLFLDRAGRNVGLRMSGKVSRTLLFLEYPDPTQNHI
jgi:hypothetical protein